MRWFERERIDRAFEPRCIAVIGAQRSNGFSWLRRFDTYKGQLASVHVNPESIRELEVLGIENHPTILDVPGPVDYVVVNTPRRLAVEQFAQCIDADVGAVSFFTSGFAETDEEGRALQQTLARMSRDSGVPLFGPNCAGVYNPGLGMCSTGGMPTGAAGPVGMVSQSGTHAGYFAKALDAWYGIREARGISYGNAGVLDAADWMEYIGGHDDVQVVGAYIEGIGNRDDGDYDRFAAALAAVTAKKPVVIWKGGNTADGARVARNHTGADPISSEDWDAILRATGAIGVGTMEALVDTVAALVRLPEPRGDRAGLLILTGGQGIAITDIFARHGLHMPALSQPSLDELATFFDPIGGSYHNPIDAAYNTETPQVLARELDILRRDPAVDFVVMDLFATIMSVDRLLSDYGLAQHHIDHSSRQVGVRFLDVLADQAARRQPGDKPFFVIVTPGAEEHHALDLREFLKDAGVLAFPSAERAAVAMRALLDNAQLGDEGRRSPQRPGNFPVA
jgi:acyl-CoA synthetase (NDP forming)